MSETTQTPSTREMLDASTIDYYPTVEITEAIVSQAAKLGKAVSVDVDALREVLVGQGLPVERLANTKVKIDRRRRFWHRKVAGWADYDVDKQEYTLAILPSKREMKKSDPDEFQDTAVHEAQHLSDFDAWEYLSVPEVGRRAHRVDRYRALLGRLGVMSAVVLNNPMIYGHPAAPSNVPERVGQVLSLIQTACWSFSAYSLSGIILYKSDRAEINAFRAGREDKDRYPHVLQLVDMET